MYTGLVCDLLILVLWGLFIFKKKPWGLIFNSTVSLGCPGNKRKSGFMTEGSQGEHPAGMEVQREKNDKLGGGGTSLTARQHDMHANRAFLLRSMIRFNLIQMLIKLFIQMCIRY